MNNTENNLDQIHIMMCVFTILLALSMLVYFKILDTKLDAICEQVECVEEE